MTDAYLKFLQEDKDSVANYYRKSLVKTEQQKFLEYLLRQHGMCQEGLVVADIACGGGTLTHHLENFLPKAAFIALDYNLDAIAIARENNSPDNVLCGCGDIYQLPLADASVDLLCCWQTLAWIDDAEAALLEMIRVVKPGGRLYLSSLFNLDFDVDLFTQVVDHTRKAGNQGVRANYYTYSSLTVSRWLQGRAKHFEILPFEPQRDFDYEGRGLGTRTLRSEAGRLQMSAGMLLNWGVLVIEK